MEIDDKATKIEQKFPVDKILYYLGGFIILASLIWIMIGVFKVFSYLGLFGVSAIYFILFKILGHLTYKYNVLPASSILYTLSLCMVPLCLYSLFTHVDFVHYSIFNNKFIAQHAMQLIIDIVTLIFGIIYLLNRRFALLTIPVSLAGLFLSFDIMPFINTQITSITLDMRNVAAFIYTLILIFIARRFEKANIEVYARWFYAIGATLLWCVLLFAFSVSFKHPELGEFGEFLLAFFGVEFIILNTILKRRIFMFWGIVGILGYIAHRGYLLFNSSPFLPILLGLFGLSIIYLGRVWAEYSDEIEGAIAKLIKS